MAEEAYVSLACTTILRRGGGVPVPGMRLPPRPREPSRGWAVASRRSFLTLALIEPFGLCVLVLPAPEFSVILFEGRRRCRVIVRRLSGRFGGGRRGGEEGGHLRDASSWDPVRGGHSLCASPGEEPSAVGCWEVGPRGGGYPAAPVTSARPKW